MIKVGILSDTHLSQCTELFLRQTKTAFADCSIILHAGDLTDFSLLSAFPGQTVHAVHGNTCSFQTQQALPAKKILTLGGYSIGLCHGAGPKHSIIERLWDMFPTVDCIVFGHTHQPLCQSYGDILFVNPGSFRPSGLHGFPGSYGLMEIDDSGIRPTLHNLPPLP